MPATAVVKFVYHVVENNQSMECGAVTDRTGLTDWITA